MFYRTPESLSMGKWMFRIRLNLRQLIHTLLADSARSSGRVIHTMGKRFFAKRFVAVGCLSSFYRTMSKPFLEFEGVRLPAQSFIGSIKRTHSLQAFCYEHGHPRETVHRNRSQSGIVNGLGLAAVPMQVKLPVARLIRVSALRHRDRWSATRCPLPKAPKAAFVNLRNLPRPTALLGRECISPTKPANTRRILAIMTF